MWGLFQKSPFGLRKESQVSDLATGCTWKQGHFGVRVWSRCREEDVQLDPARRKGDRPAHIKFMTCGPGRRGARQEALNPSRKE